MGKSLAKRCRRAVVVVLAILFICGGAPRLSAQTSGATLTGRVVDQSGAGVPGGPGVADPLGRVPDRTVIHVAGQADGPIALVVEAAIVGVGRAAEVPGLQIVAGQAVFEHIGSADELGVYSILVNPARGDDLATFLRATIGPLRWPSGRL